MKKYFLIIYVLFFYGLTYSQTPEPILWTGITNVTVSATGGLQPTTNNVWQGGAHSSQFILANKDGYFELAPTRNWFMFGLSLNPTGAHYNTIDFAIQLWGTSVYIVESGSQRGQKTTVNINSDVFQISKEGNQIHYKKNGITFYTSGITVDPLLPLHADVSCHNTTFYMGNGMILTGEVINTNVIIQGKKPIQWTDITNVTVSASGGLQPTTNNAWQGGAHSSQFILANKDGYFELAPTRNWFMFGLSLNPTGAHYNTIDFAIQLWGTGVYVVESGIQRGQKTTVDINNDVFQIEKEGSQIHYKKNGATFYTSDITVDPSLPLYADVSCHNTTFYMENGMILTGEIINQSITFETVFYELENKMGSSYVEATNDKLYFLFHEKYNQGVPSYKIYNAKREVVQSSQNEIINHGENRYALSLGTASLASGFYVLEVADANGKLYKLRFKY